MGGLLAGYFARAAGGAARSPLVFSGNLSRDGTPLTGTQTLQFTFEKPGGATCSSGDLSVTPDSKGNFAVDVPLTDCPDDLFHAIGVTMDVAVNGNAVVQDRALGAVPYALHAEHVAFADCPLGYVRDTSATNIVACLKNADAMVLVGEGASAFWIDRYEASIWQYADGSGSQYGIGTPYPASFPANGQASPQNALYALSKAGVRPSLGATWFQATRACRAAGKRLPNGEEWLAAAAGTADPGLSAGENGTCVTWADDVRTTGDGTACVSFWGAEDMIGSAFEWTSEWAGGGTPIGSDAGPVGVKGLWPAGYNGDATFAFGVLGFPDYVGLPVVIGRGGAFFDGEGAGIFSLGANLPPVVSDSSAGGFRCVIMR
jgi:hypothetical protein